MSLNDKIRRELRIALIDSDKTQRDLAKQLGYTTATINRLFAGNTKIILPTAEKVLDALGLTLEVVRKEPKE